MPPPLSAGEDPLARPLVMAKLAMLTVFPNPIWNTRLAWFALIARLAGPGPVMATFLATRSSPLVSVMVAGVIREKLIVSPLAAPASASRSVPGPLSAVLVTVIVAA